MSNMNLLVVILKHEDLVSEICKELVEEGIHGGTIVDGTGMAQRSSDFACLLGK